MSTELVWSTGGYPHTYRPRTAGQWGCNPCWGCDKRPPAGARVWTNSYGDLYCDPCAQRRAAAHKQAELIAHLKADHRIAYQAEPDLVRIQTVHAAAHT